MVIVYQSISPYSIDEHYGKKVRLHINTCIDNSNKTPTEIEGILRESSNKQEIIFEIDNTPLHIPIKDIQRVLIPKTVKTLDISDKGLVLKL